MTGRSPAKPGEIRMLHPHVKDRLKQVARMIAAGETIASACRQLGFTAKTIQNQVRSKRYGDFWQRELTIARRELEALGLAKKPWPRPEIRDTIRKATARLARGEKYLEVAAAMSIDANTLKHYRQTYSEAWREEYDRAMETALEVVRRQAGTDAVLTDPEAFIRQALAVEKWAHKAGGEIFHASDKPTLGSFCQTYYKPTRLHEARPRTVEMYDSVVKHWRLLTGDPALDEITQETLTRYRDCLSKLRGLKVGTYLSKTSIHGRLLHVQAILDKAGPPGFRNRDAAGIIERAPWIRRPKPEAREPRFVPDGLFEAVYTAAVAMDLPKLFGFKPPAWWRALIVTAYCTQLRRRTLFEMRMEHIDWESHCLRLPGSLMKSGRAELAPLNATALEHLRAIRTDRELVFPWPYSREHFHRVFHRLQDAAGIPAAEHFQLHDIRKTAGTVLWSESPEAAQFALGHRSPETTRRHYVAGKGLVARAIEEMPLPAAFTTAIAAGRTPAIAAAELERRLAELDRQRDQAARELAKVQRQLEAALAVA